ncbi:hypothetical protein B1C78_09060 [Thioalkalivibrio denitrificans]|uniref:Uncharacterized protein n=1 Tax=Thioalkalivibrio denitrificans TaxID=108003 RepID=A0A1V3NH32_9GAMM|nr:hypothetical protein B1C78_09060 [Thioalkalivibrio denitrificans]
MSYRQPGQAPKEGVVRIPVYRNTLICQRLEYLLVKILTFLEKVGDCGELEVRGPRKHWKFVRQALSYLPQPLGSDVSPSFKKGLIALE